ncbi:MAG: hypothetical protein J5903_00710 [Clostridia bacterium]|nr:hypothetical protein [Clostridia bacterium]
MKTYIISVLVAAVLFSLCEMIVPSGKIKTTVKLVLSAAFALVMIAPIFDFDASELFSFDVETETAQAELTAYVDEKTSSTYGKYIKEILLQNDLVAEKVEVEICRMKIEKVRIYLSNLVIPENDGHINNNVIGEYVAGLLGLNCETVEIYG